MKLRKSSKPNSSTNSGVSTSKSSLNDAKPFSQQFDYHLHDVPIQRRPIAKPPTGQVLVHFGDMQPFPVDFYARESISDFRERIEQISKLPMKNYTIACRNGTMTDDKSIDDYNLSDQSTVVIFEKGCERAMHIKARDGWLKSRQTRKRGSLPVNMKFLTDLKVVKKPQVDLKKDKGMVTCPSVETFLNQMSIDCL